MITPYYMPKAVKIWKDKKVRVVCYKLFEVLENENRIYIDIFVSRGAARREKRILESRFPWKKYAIMGDKIL